MITMIFMVFLLSAKSRDSASCLSSVIPTTLQRRCYGSQLTEKATEVQGGKLTCLRLYSQGEEEPVFIPISKSLVCTWVGVLLLFESCEWYCLHFISCVFMVSGSEV